MNTSDDEGTPMLGPLPLELQQIKAQKDAAAAMAARRKSEDYKLSDISIKLRRSSTGDTASIISPDDSATRRSSRPIKRKKFDDELPEQISSPGIYQGYPSTGQLGLGSNSVIESPRSRNASLCESVGGATPSIDPGLVNSCQALPDLKKKKFKNKSKRRRGEGAMKDLGRWKATDDLALITAVGQTRDLGSVIKGVKFSCHFSLSEVQERWYALMYDPVISKLALEAVRNLPQEIVHKVTRNTPFSKEEEDAIGNCGLKSTSATVDITPFENLLSSQASVFHSARTAKDLQIHWQYMKQYSLLPDQAVQPLPKQENAQHILNFHDGEEQVIDSDLLDPPDLKLNNELSIVDRMAKREIRRLEAEVSKWAIVVEQVTGQPSPDFDNQTLAVLRGRLVRYLMRSREISVGRATTEHNVDVDLTLEGPASKVSRRQAIIKLTNSGEFYLANEGSRPVMVNGKAIISGELAKLANNTVVEFCNLRFVFLINLELIEAIRNEAAKNQFVTKQ